MAPGAGATSRRPPGPLRAAALIATVAGAVGSVAFTLYYGRHNPSRLLVMVFVLWVLAPFLGLLWGSVTSGRWAAATRTALHGVTLIVAIGSLAIYGSRALGPVRPQGAFVFMVVPAASWLLTAAVVAAAAVLSRRTGKPFPDA